MYDLLYTYFKSKTQIDKDTFKSISPAFQFKKIRRKEYLLRHSQICISNYFVNKGCLRFFTIDKEGKEHTRYFAIEGKFGTALSSFIEQQPSWEFIQAVEDTELLVFGRADFYHLVETVEQVNIIYRDILEMAYVTSQKRIYGLQGETALDRLKWLMEYQPKILSRLSNKMVASYLGVTPYTLSRMKAEL